MNLYKKCTAKAYDTIASDYRLHVRHILLKKIEKLIMTIDYKIRDEKLKYDHNSEAAKIPALLTNKDKYDEYEYLTVKEILPSDQSSMRTHIKFTYFALGKALQKESKTIEEAKRKKSARN